MPLPAPPMAPTAIANGRFGTTAIDPREIAMAAEPAVSAVSSWRAGMRAATDEPTMAPVPHRVVSNA